MGESDSEGAEVPGVDSLLFSLSINLFTFFLSVYLFTSWRAKASPTFHRLYLPNLAAEEDKETKSDEYESLSKLYGDGMDSVRLLPDTKQDKMLEHVGLDGYIYLQTYAIGQKLFGILSIAMLPLALIYWLPPQCDEAHGLNRLSISNVPDRSHLLMFSVVASYIVSGLLFVLLAIASRDFRKLRFKLLNLKPPGVEDFMLLVRDIPSVEGEASWVPKTVDEFPSKLQALAEETKAFMGRLLTGKSVAQGSASHEIVQRFMAGTYPFDLGIEAMMVPPTEELETLVKNHQDLKDQIEDAIAQEQAVKEAAQQDQQNCNSTLNPMMAATETLGFAPKTSEALQEELEVAAAELEKCYSRLEDERSSTAMVYIPSLYYAALAPQVLHTQDCETWNVERAPLPSDIIWSNLHLRWWERLIREIAIFIINFLITVFFLIPVTFVSSLATMDNIEDAIPALESLEDYPSLVAFLDGYLPGVVLTIFIALVPLAMKALSHYKSEITHSSLEYATAAKFYWVLVLDVFLGNAIVQAILRELDDLLDNFDVSAVLEAIGNSVPKSSFFFISYIIARIGVSLPVEMFRLGKVFLYYLTAPTRRTPTQERAAWSPKYFDFTSNIGNLHLLVLLGLVYALVAPLVCVAAWLYFYFAKYVYFNQLLFVYDTKPYDTKGKIWPAIFDFFVINLAISQIILVGVLAVKQSPFLSIQMFLPALTGLYYFVMTNRYSKAFHHVPLDVASLLNQRVAHVKDWKTCQAAYFPLQTGLMEMKQKHALTPKSTKYGTMSKTY